MTLSEYMAMFPGMDATAFLIGSIIGALTVAFFGFRLFKLSLFISFAAGGFTIGYTAFSLVFPEGIEGLGFDAGLIVGLALALILGILSVKLYKALIYFVGGAWGAMLGFIIPYMILFAFEQETIGIIVGAVVAIVLAIIFAKGLMKAMKYIVIIETALGGMAMAFESAAMLVFGDAEYISAISYMAGLIIGIFAVKLQLNMNKDRDLF